MTIHLGLLGSVEATLDGTAVPIGPRSRAILALLAFEAPRLVTPEQILDSVWTGKRPARPANAVQTQLTLLRRALPGVTITWQSGGYRLVADPATIDLHRFRVLVGKANTATSDKDAVRFRAAALALWRGDPFADIDLPWFTSTRDNLTAEREAVTLDHTDARLRLGQYEAVLADLRAHATRRPLDERVAGQLMLALNESGRTDDALRHYETLRERLVDELGADPGTRLQELRERIRGGGPPHNGPVPRQLPPAPGSFTGRADQLAAMTAILDNAAETGGTVVISAIAGTGGIGKTWLTLYWAHQHRDRFPDGQLFADLRGFSPANQPVTTETALLGFLDALGIAPDQIPAGLDAQAALWRTLLADRRLLIVLDNAASTEQVVPLLPGGSRSTVLVNSRDRLSGLATRHGAHQVAVDVLAAAEARELLRTRLGADRVDAEPAAAEELLAYCGGFPLALGIVIALALNHPDFPLAALAAELGELQLSALDNDEPTASLPSVLSWSYTALTAEQARAFDLLGIAPGTDISITAAASLIERSPARTRGLLRGLERASLLHQRVPGRYGMHDLVRAYARGHADAETEPALHRLLDFYLRSMLAAEGLIKPIQPPLIKLGAPVAGAHPRTFDDIDEAARWFTDEYQNLTAAQNEAQARDWPEQTWQLAFTLTGYRSRTSRMQDNLDAFRAGLAAALRLGDPEAEALARLMGGKAHRMANQLAESNEQFTESMRIAVSIGATLIELFSGRFLNSCLADQGLYTEAVELARRTLALSEATGNMLWIANDLMHLAWAIAHLGDYEQAKTYCLRARDMHLSSRVDDHSSLGNLFDSLGFIVNGLGEYEAAIGYYEQALERYAMTDIYYMPETYEHMGQTYVAMGRFDDARAAWRAALRICRDQHRTSELPPLQELLDSLPG